MDPYRPLYGPIWTPMDPYGPLWTHMRRKLRNGKDQTDCKEKYRRQSSKERTRHQGRWNFHQAEGSTPTLISRKLRPYTIQKPHRKQEHASNPSSPLSIKYRLEANLHIQPRGIKLSDGCSRTMKICLTRISVSNAITFYCSRST